MFLARVELTNSLASSQGAKNEKQIAWFELWRSGHCRYRLDDLGSFPSRSCARSASLQPTGLLFKLDGISQ
jgi:hypothetical protein